MEALGWIIGIGALIWFLNMAVNGNNTDNAGK
jgi:hypothetical protein